MKRHHASFDREQGRTSHAQSPAMQITSSIAGIPIVLTSVAFAPCPDEDGPDRFDLRETDAIRP
jgi:hypothetical protein